MDNGKPAIFINYRRALSRLEARLLYLMLDARFPGQVFLDEEKLEGGDRWRPLLKKRVREAKVLLSLIPHGWAQYAGDGIQSKLNFDENCYVRKELETAMESGTVIVPVLLNGAEQPPKKHLPKSIKSLFEEYNNGVPLDFQNPEVGDFEKLFRQLAEKAGLTMDETASRANIFQGPTKIEFPLPTHLAEMLPAAPSPFVGLQPFREKDARIFFGRSREIYDLCHKVLREDKPRLLLLDGYSGTGKSSLLQAGLIPRVKAAGWQVAYRRREEDKVRGLKGVFEKMLAEVAASPAKRKLLILDQVEEAVTDRIEGLPNELTEFAAALRQAFLENTEHKFILAFRSEQMARIAKVLENSRLPFDQKNTLHPLDLTGVREALSGTSEDDDLRHFYRLRFSPPAICGTLAKRLLSGWEHYHIAPLVQVNMGLLWEKCRQDDGSVSITAHDIEGIIDRQDGLLDHYLALVREELSEAQVDDLKILELLRFHVQNEPASAIRLREEFLQNEVFKNDLVYQKTLDELKKHYLLLEVDSDGKAATRLSHDVMAKAIHQRHERVVQDKLAERTEGYFDELLAKLKKQLYQLQYPAAQATLRQLLELGIRRQELRPFLLELLFFWNEAARPEQAAEALRLCIDSQVFTGAADPSAVSTLSANSTKNIRQWLQRTAPNFYQDLRKKYLAPPDTVMVKVPGGKLTIGEGEEKRRAEISTFRMANVQTTFWKYGLFLFAEGKEKRLKEKAPSWGINGDHPAVKVDWYDAVEYCNWLSGAQGLEKFYLIDRERKDPNNENEHDKKKWLVKTLPQANGFRLPTEVEWEFAARGGLQSHTDSHRYKFAGGDDLKKVGWYRENSGNKTHPVGQLKANELGLFDMSGNVWEWCGDWYVAYPGPLPKDFAGAGKGTGRVLRGGSWNGLDDLCRVACRGRDVPDVRDSYVGFRLAQGYT